MLVIISETTSAATSTASLSLSLFPERRLTRKPPLRPSRRIWSARLPHCLLTRIGAQAKASADDWGSRLSWWLLMLAVLLVLLLAAPGVFPPLAGGEDSVVEQEHIASASSNSIRRSTCPSSIYGCSLSQA
eukprot:scaffold75031_cov33-Tisochrysis_lutea.AAC.1